jgi:hypothetical protein
MNQGRGGMGNHKHGTSGVAPKSPRLRHKMKREAGRNERRAKPSTCTASSIAELLGQK